MNMPTYRIEEWYRFILENRAGGPFICVGSFPPELARKFAAICLPYRQLDSLDDLDSSCDGIAWIVDGLSGAEAISRLAILAKARQPATLYFELAPEALTGRRPEIELAFFAAGYRKSPRYHAYVEYSDSCYWNRQYSFERMPEACLQKFSNRFGTNQAEAGLHRDMLRDTDRRADAHTMRYHWASTYLRPHDIVLDAACGLGYGSSILAHNSECAKVIGLDNSDYAIQYAKSAYAADSGRVEFAVRDLATLSDFKDASVHAIVSFETLEHLQNPALFLKECQRVLIPGGRFICSVPNHWVDENGKDPNPYHLQIYTRDILVKQLSEFFILEHVYAEKAGAGFLKFERDARELFETKLNAPEPEAEWWLAVGMKDPVGVAKGNFKNHFYPQMEAAETNLGAFGRDHEHPWMIASTVIRGLRTTSGQTLRDLTFRELALARKSSADQGAALCVLGYQLLETGDRSALSELINPIQEYLGAAGSNPHQIRWKISLKFLLGRIYMEWGDSEKAKEYFLGCAEEDCLQFGPTLGTKPVEALFFCGWLFYQQKQKSHAVESWKRGIVEAERILKTSNWREIHGREDLPFDFGLAEIMIILQKAQQCAFAIYAVESGIYEPGLLDLQIIYNATLRNSINREHVLYLEDHNRYLMDQFLRKSEENRQLGEENKSLSAAVHKLGGDQAAYIKALEAELEKKDKILKKLQRNLSG